MARSLRLSFVRCPGSLRGRTRTKDLIMANDTGIIEETKKAVTDNERPLGEQAPGTPFIFVALSYLAVLAVVSGVVALIMWSSN
ncbi:MAG: hypothetical protein Rhob2KO_11280 [Rhodopirellula baltica]